MIWVFSFLFIIVFLDLKYIKIQDERMVEAKTLYIFLTLELTISGEIAY